MKNFFLIAMVIIFSGNFFANLAHAEIKTYTGVGDYVLSEDVPPGDIKSKAKMYAQKNALEQAGVFVSGLTEVKNNIVSKDEIITIVGGILKIIDTKFEIIPLNDAAGIAKYRATVTAQIDTNLLDAAIKNWLNRDANEKANLVQQNKAQQETIANLQKKISELEKQAAAVKTTQDKKTVQENFAGIDRETLAIQKFYEGIRFTEKNNWQDAISNYTESINLNPKNSRVYAQRSNAYRELGKIDEALADVGKAIELDNSNPEIYSVRGNIYNYQLKNYQKAMQDYDKAIKLNPNYAWAYIGRGDVYNFLGEYAKALKEVNHAIQINSKIHWAYSSRGWIHYNLKNYQKAIEDFETAIQIGLKADYVYAGRGFCYQALGRNAEAEKDFAKARQLGWNG